MLLVGVCYAVISATSGSFVGAEVVGSGTAAPFTIPNWDYKMLNDSACIRTSPTNQTNNRWTHFALPKGTAPKGGWPVWLKFQPWTLPPAANTAAAASNTTCGSRGGSSELSGTCIAYLKQNCPNKGAETNPAKLTECLDCVGHLNRTEPAAWKAAGCPAPKEEISKYTGLLWCKYGGSFKHHGSYPIFAEPGGILAACFKADGSFKNDGSCSFSGLAGQMWDERWSQYLLDNGVAILQPNCQSMDMWEWYSQDLWDTGFDKPYFEALFKAITDGTFGSPGGTPIGKGVLNLHKMGVSGYSVGAQMVSWFFQLQATNQLAPLVTVKSGAFFGGGTYQCYNNPPQAMAQCSNCNASDSCLQIGCSNTLVAANITPCCQYCCPEGYTEQYYKEHPEAYPQHPPTALIQHTTVDENADGCAARNYHAEMLKHGGDSTLLLIPADQERCYCVGQAGVAADAGSPFAKQCPHFLPGLGNTSCTLPPSNGAGRSSSSSGDGGGLLGECQTPSRDGERCMYHPMGFSGMLEPLMTMVKKTLL